MRYIECCQGNLWHLQLSRAGDSSHLLVPFRCRSWRHHGECCRWKAAQDWCRIRDAIKKREDWVYVVLTYDPADWDDWRDQYRQSLPIWQKMLKRMTREYDVIQYVQTWERHKKGGLHVNLLIGNDTITSLCDISWRKWRKYALEPMAVACGYGKRTYVTPFRKGTGDAMAGYLGKLSRELVGADYKGQIPYDAPKHFRRIRASRGLLPPIKKSDYVGELVMHPMPGRTTGYGIGGEISNDDVLTE